ncbi:efflux RND transporter permease subunit [Teredinibacter haidensis]|uniref:efflux RND transporter permease subunit n=1 Tax=Teredinibacter haidensis TaxID=2731755 RepID=UPI000948F4B1|nr:efflux RND transporter permease subunit [Teredinibacter haidensis]
MKGLIRWFIDNPIAANLLMIAMLIGGISGSGVVKKETFPAYIGNRIQISMVYPGAGPSEVEQQIVVRIEEAISDLPGIFQITSDSREGFGFVNVEVTEDFDARVLLGDIKGRVDAINTFPSSAERPIVRQQVRRQFLMWAALYGDAELRELKNIAYQIRDEMSLLEGVSEVQITGLKSDEVSIEISEGALRRYNLSFSEVASAIRQTSVNVPAGTIKTKDGDIQIQTRAQAFDYDDFAKIVVRSHRDGSQLRLGDIAVINDGFSEQNVDFALSGKRGLNLEIKMSDDPLLFEGTANARTYIEEFNKSLKEGIKLQINFESREIFDSRFNLLKDNALSGLILVFIILMLFLRPILAFWVVAGIATTFAGAIWLLPFFDVSINMLSMFAFLMVLGIVVDDAIIVGESIYRHQQRGEKGKLSAYTGTFSVLKPVFLAVVSTIMFFLPMIDVPSEVLIYTRSIFFVVFLCLVFSLVESLLVLPSHLSHMGPEKPSRFYFLQKIESVRHWFSYKMERFAEQKYLPALRMALHHKASTILGFFFVFAIAVSIVAAGWINSSFFPNVPRPFVIVNVGFADGTPFSRTQEAAEYILEKVSVVAKDKELLELNGGQPFIREINRSLNGTSLTVFVGLVPLEERAVSTDEVAEKLRKLVGPMPEAQSFSLNASLSGDGPDITLNMNMLENRREVQQAAVSDITAVLAAYPGVFNVRSNLDSERTEVEISLKPYAETLGISLGNVAGQVRQGFYGDEIQRIPRAKEDVRVMLRYRSDERQTLDTLDHVRIRTTDGREIPISAVADVNLVSGSSTIRRVDRRRNIAITAEVEEGQDANRIVMEMLESNSAKWKQSYLGFNLSTDGSLRTRAQFGDNFASNFLKIFIVVLSLFAIAFRSLFQPFLVMLAVPFGFVGAVIGHMLFGVDISIFSFFGFLACSGVVVNDNLVLLERINTLRARGETALDAVLNAGIDRFRPIVLTSLTTFVGLLPILFERSNQAQFLIPMVLSLSFGVAFSSVITLFLVPVSYLGGDRLKARVIGLFRNEPSVADVVQGKVNSLD